VHSVHDSLELKNEEPEPFTTTTEADGSLRGAANVPDLLARVGEWLAIVELDADGRVAVRECSDHHVPADLLEECREHKQEKGRLE